MAQNKETWKAIPNEDGCEASSLGNIRKDGKPVKLFKEKTGYITTTLNNKKYRVHRLVYCAFNNVVITPKDYIMHMNNVKNNNDIGNLKLGNAKSNSRHRSICGLNKGETNNYSIHKRELIMKIRKMYASGKKQIEISKELGISKYNIYNIVKRRVWKHI